MDSDDEVSTVSGDVTKDRLLEVDQIKIKPNIIKIERNYNKQRS